jgi:hypothetical protein
MGIQSVAALDKAREDLLEWIEDQRKKMEDERRWKYAMERSGYLQALDDVEDAVKEIVCDY